MEPLKGLGMQCSGDGVMWSKVCTKCIVVINAYMCSDDK